MKLVICNKCNYTLRVVDWIVMKTLVKTVIIIDAPIDTTSENFHYLLRWIVRMGDVDQWSFMFTHGINKDSIDQDGYSMLCHVVDSGNIEAVRYLLDIGVAIPTYAP